MLRNQYKPSYEDLKNKWLDQQKELQRGLLEKHKEAFEWLEYKSKQFVVGTVGSLLMFAQPVTASIAATQPHPQTHIEVPDDNAIAPETKLILDLDYSLPADVQPLTEDQEKVIGQTLSRHFGIPVAAALQGKRLNQSYGIIGAEQHLVRYPGDTMNTHFDSADEADLNYSSGMAPGRGAWGYFAPSAAEMTKQDELREKYYIAVQTFLAPGFDGNVKDHYDFFKYRKMLVVNPQNGHGIVVDIADAGPAPWTGKQLGGSPEVMKYLDRKDGKQRGPVLYFFVYDPDDTIPLGPIPVKQ
jgi:hypothetical protein